MLNTNQLVWRCRRGVRELDVLFGRFLESEYAKLNNQEKSDFEQLLEVQDPVIMDWLFCRAEISDPKFTPLMQRLKKLSGL